MENLEVPEITSQVKIYGGQREPKQGDWVSLWAGAVSRVTVSCVGLTQDSTIMHDLRERMIPMWNMAHWFAIIKSKECHSPISCSSCIWEVCDLWSSSQSVNPRHSSEDARHGHEVLSVLVVELTSEDESLPLRVQLKIQMAFDLKIRRPLPIKTHTEDVECCLFDVLHGNKGKNHSWWCS